MRKPLFAASLFLVTGLVLTGLLLALVLDDLRHRSTQESARSYGAMLTVFRDYYTSVVVKRAKAGGLEITTDYHQTEKALPPPATMTIELGVWMGDLIPQGGFRYVSRYPFANRSGSRRSDLELEALAWLIDRREREVTLVRHDAGKGRTVLHFAQPITMGKGCVDCHNAHPDSPKRDWKIGDVRGAQIVSLALPPLLPNMDHILANERGVLIAGLVLLAGLGIVSVLLLFLMRRLRRAAVLAERRNHLLVRARLQAENDAAAKTRVMNNVSHELLTPMNAIMGFSSLMKAQSLGPLGHPRYQTYAVNVSASAERLMGIIQNMLSMAEAQNAGDEAPAERIDTGRELRRLIMTEQDAAQTEGVTVALDQNSRFPQIRGVQRSYRQMMGNLITNAVRHAGRGAHCIIAARIQGDNLVFTVSDNGTGIAAADRKKILTLFEGAADPCTDQATGIGIGLNVAQEMAWQLGGSLAIRSAPGEGFQVDVALPATLCVNEADMPGTEDTQTDVARCA